MKIQLTLFVVYGMLIHGYDGACNRGPSKFIKGYGGEITYYCIYKKEYFLLENETLKTPSPDCMKCTCKRDGLSCCGYGAALMGVMSVPGNSKCKPRTIGCEIMWFYRDNPQKICPKSDRNFF